MAIKNVEELKALQKQYKKSLNKQYKKVIVCGGTGCVANGSMEVYKKLKKLVDEKGILAEVNLEKEDEVLAEKVRNKPHFVVLNKRDLLPQLNKSDVSLLYPGEEILEVSALRGEGIEKLLRKIGERIKAEIGPEDQTILITARQREGLKKALLSLVQARDSLREGMSLDVLGLDLEEALREMGRILGTQADKELLNTIFSQFCLGK